MPSRRVTSQEKKLKGSFNVTRDKDSDFEIRDGLVTMIPAVPEDYTPEMADVWQRYWRHLVKHQYGKESDFEIMDTTIREWAKYHHFRTYDQSQSHKSLTMFMKGIEMLGISPTAMAKMASVQKKKVQLSPTEIAKQKAQ